MKKRPFKKKILYGLIVLFIAFVALGFTADTEPPVITAKKQTIEYGTELTFSELVSVEDNTSEEIEISILSSDVNGITCDDENQTILFADIGTYEVEISATDKTGNASSEIVFVEVLDKTEPIIESDLEIFLLTENDKKGDYLLKLSAYDEIDGNLTENIEIDDSEVRYGEVGEYKFEASVVDKSGNVYTQLFNVKVEDTTAPVLTFSKTSFSLIEGNSAPDYIQIVKANDSVDGDITSFIIIDDSNVDYDSAGTYEVKYTITDNSGNSTTENITVTIKEKSKSASTSNSSSGGGQVMITRTGSCYHTHKCGNGTYFWVSFSEAKSRGLRACKKCY